MCPRNSVFVPGFRTVAEVEELARAMRYGPLSQEEFDRVAEAMRAPL